MINELKKGFNISESTNSVRGKGVPQQREALIVKREAHTGLLSGVETVGEGARGWRVHACNSAPLEWGRGYFGLGGRSRHLQRQKHG